jgi:hypothetical protein
MNINFGNGSVYSGDLYECGKCGTQIASTAKECEQRPYQPLGEYSTGYGTTSNWDIYIES